MYNSTVENEINAKTFTLDIYTQILKKYIKTKVYQSVLGQIASTQIDPYFINHRPACLLFGESNRMKERYPLIKALLKQSSLKGFIMQRSCYYQTLYLSLIHI